MIFFSLIFKSVATWPWIVEGIIFAALSLMMLLVKLTLPLATDREDPPLLLWSMFSLGAFFTTGPAVFCGYRLFCGWASSGWWLYLFLILGIVASFVPGGFSIMTIILQNMGTLTSIPTWVWAIIIAIDAINLISFIVCVIKQARLKRMR